MVPSTTLYRHLAPETLCIWKSTVTLGFLANGCLNWEKPELFVANRESKETLVMKSALPVNGVRIAHRAVIAVMGPAIRSLENVPEDVQNVGWEGIVKQRRKIVMRGHQLNVHQTPSPSLTTIAAVNRCRDVSACPDSAVMDTKIVMIVEVLL
ncbi:hypothetical protein RB195_008970 [Necator americanus]|uniref:Uncharacterized protein n=1 Tax=Necator americanus TaxID=51031 RepID=A0ABR1CTQ6_NECAM